MPTQETKTPFVARNPKPSALAYRQRAGYSQAIVALTDAETGQRRDYWLGEFDRPESRERYHRVIAEWERRGRRLPPPDFDAPAARRDAVITIVAATVKVDTRVPIPPPSSAAYSTQSCTLRRIKAFSGLRSDPLSQAIPVVASSYRAGLR